MPEHFTREPNGKMFASNGVDPVLVWNGFGSDMEIAGVPAPTAKPTISATGQGAISGTYFAYVRFVDESGVPGNLSPISASVTADDAWGIVYGNVQTPDENKVARRQILRNTNGQTDVFYVDVDTTDLTSTSFNSIKSDDALSASEAVPIFDAEGFDVSGIYGRPPNDKPFMAYHNGRMFAAGEEVYDKGDVAVTFGSTTVTGHRTRWKSTMVGRFIYVAGADKAYEIASVQSATSLTIASSYRGATSLFASYAIRPAPAQSRVIAYSQAGLSESWDVTDGFSLPEDGDSITGMVVMGSFLYILERRHIYRFTHQSDPAEDGFVFLSADRGCVNNRCWIVVEDTAYMLDEQGVHKFGGGNQEHLSGQIQDLFRPDARETYRINWDAKRWFHAAYDQPSEVIRWFVTLSGGRYPRHAIAYSFRDERWWIEEYPHSVAASCTARLGGPSGRQQLFLGGAAKDFFALQESHLDFDPGGTVDGSVTSAGLFTLVDNQAQFSAGLGNAPVAIVSGRGKGQWNRIASASSTQLTLVRPWLVTPDSTSRYRIGAFPFRFQMGWMRYAPIEEDNVRRAECVFKPVRDNGATFDLLVYLDFSETPMKWQYTSPASAEAGVAVTKGRPDLECDATKVDGIVQKRMDGYKELYADGRRHTSWAIEGFATQDQQEIYGIIIDGVVVPGGNREQ